jgi:hypothetical protein
MMIAEGNLSFPTSAPHKLAFAFHNAIAISTQFPEYRKYSGLHAKYIVRVKPGKVLCEIRGGVKDVSPASVLTQQTSKMAFENTTVEGIVGAMLTSKVDEGYFPGARLSIDELVALWKWTVKNNYYVIDNEDAGVTITKEKTGLEFTPEMS